MTSGAVIFILIMLMVNHFQNKMSLTDQLISKTRRLDLLNQMRLNLTSASEAEKSAVMAVTDQDSKFYSGKARSYTVQLEENRKELSDLLLTGGTKSEKELIIQFSNAFVNLQRIDTNLLDLALRNTNLKAFDLAFGPAAEAISAMEFSLKGLIDRKAKLQDAGNITSLALRAQIAALNIQNLLAPHISEESDSKMDELESRMSKEDQIVQRNLNDLALLGNVREDSLFKTAVDDYSRFSLIKKQILLFSRENTNVRSLSISLGQKRSVETVCQDILLSLQKAVSEEPVEGLNYGIESNPRSLQR